MRLKVCPGSCTKRLPRHLASKSMVLQIEEPGGALDIGEGFRTRHLLPLEHLTGAKRPFELPHEFFQVVLHDTVQRHQVAVDVVDDFNRCGLGPFTARFQNCAELFSA